MGGNVFTQRAGRRLQPTWWLVCFAAALVSSLDRGAIGASMIDRTGRFAIQWWTADDGLPDSQLKGVAIAPDGSIVCATNRQLVQFDGVSFKPFPPQLTDSLHEAIGGFWGVGFDGAGRLWVQGSQKVARLDTVHGRGGDEAVSQRWKVFALADGRITGMMFGKDGRPVFIGPGIVLRFDGEKIVPLAVRPPDDAAVPWMFGGVDPNDGALWLWGSAGKKRVLYRCEQPGGDRGAAVVREQAAVISTGVITMGFGPSGALALLPDCVAVHRSNAWVRLPPTLPDAGYRISGKLVESSDNTLWISSHNGLLACRDGMIETAIEGLPGFSYFTHHLAADASGGIWAACSGGLLAVRRTALAVESINECRAVFERSDGKLIVGTPGALTLHAPPTGDEKMAAPRLLASLPKEAIPTAILEAEDGRIWVGTQDNFLLRIDGEAVTQVTKPAEHFRELRCIHALASDTHGRVWAATSNGLAVHDPETDGFNTIGAHEGPLRPFVIGVAAEPEGGVLAASLGGGVTRVAPDGATTPVIGAAEMPGRRHVVFHRDTRGTLWIGGDRGLVRVGGDGRCFRLSTSTGLVDEEICQIEEDRFGRLWLATARGYLQGILLDSLDSLAAGRVSLVRGVVLGPLDGLGENACIGRVARADTDHERSITVPLSSGIVRLDPARFRNGPPRKAAPVVRRDPAIPFGFSYSSPGVAWDGAPLYQTRLAGVDAAWSPPDGSRRRAYGALPSGHHTFEVRTVAGETADEFPTTAFALHVPTPWWRTPWAVAGMAAAAGCLAAVVTREATRLRARRRIAQLERQREMDRERARIARDIHDSLGAGLTRMALMSDLARRTGLPPERVHDRLDAIYRNARGLARSVDEIVWAVNPRNDTLTRFISYIVNDVEEFARAGDLALRLHVPDELPDGRPLAAQIRHHVCLAVREVLQNVLRHAQATHLDFTIAVNAGALTVTVQDDGVGFDSCQQLADEQDGLENIRSRAAEAGGSVAIQTSPGCGTTVSLTVPLPARPHPALRISAN